MKTFPKSSWHLKVNKNNIDLSSEACDDKTVDKSPTRAAVQRNLSKVLKSSV